MTEVERKIHDNWDRMPLGDDTPVDPERVLEVARKVVKLCRKEGLTFSGAVSVMMTAVVLALPSHGGAAAASIHRVAVALAGRASGVQRFVDGATRSSNRRDSSD